MGIGPFPSDPAGPEGMARRIKPPEGAQHRWETDLFLRDWEPVLQLPLVIGEKLSACTRAFMAVAAHGDRNAFPEGEVRIHRFGATGLFKLIDLSSPREPRFVFKRGEPVAWGDRFCLVVWRRVVHLYRRKKEVIPT